MANNNSPISLLNIDFSIKKGLILNWNFKGELSNTNFYRHLIILDTNDFAKVQSFLKLYYKKIKNGDIFAIKKTFKNKCSKSLKWKEKNLIDSPDFDKIHSECFEISGLAEAVYDIADFVDDGEIRWPLIVSILTQKKNSQKLISIVQEVRKQKKSFNFIVNMFGTFKNSINFRNGINFFEFNASNKQNILQFYKNYINRIQFYYVQLQIECENGSICCQKSSDWPNTSFNRITKQFYGPHMDYDSDTLFFLNSQSYGQLDLLLHISLEYETFEGRKFKSSKRISLKSFDTQIQSRTVGINDHYHELEMHKNVWFQKYPYKSQYFVWFNREKNNSKDSFKQDQQFS